MIKILRVISLGFFVSVFFVSAAFSQVSYLFEGFDAVTSGSTTPVPGWTGNNLSSPVGPSGWSNGNLTYFAAHQGAGFIAANFENGSTTTLATNSNWLFSPVLNLQNGYIVKFFTRTISFPNRFPDRLQFRLSTEGASLDVGSTATSTGVFSTLLVDINPTYTQTDYPGTWTEYTFTLAGLPNGVTPGRVAFRYFVENAGGLGSNSNYMGIDNFLYSSDGLLPVVLNNFSCLVGDKNLVSLKWKTSFEQNNAYFAVERSLDGIQFAEIDRVAAKKSNSSFNEYAYEDITAEKVQGVTRLFYRLKQTDLDGQFKFSSIVKAQLNRESNLSFVTIINRGSEISARFNASKSSMVEVALLNGTGQQIDKRKQLVVEGINTVNFLSAELPKGIYYLRLTDGRTIVTGKLVR